MLYQLSYSRPMAYNPQPPNQTSLAYLTGWAAEEVLVERGGFEPP